MATRKDFCNAMLQVYKDHGVYIGTANGERTLDIAGKIFEMEKNYGRRDDKGNPLWYNDAARDYEYIGKCYRNHYDMSKSIAGDCSGIIYGVLKDLGVQKHDMRARDYQAASTPVKLKNLQPGDLVFDKTSEASHVGVYIGDPNYVIDSRGRDKGVIKSALSSYSWKIGGRLDWFSDDIPVLTRNLYYKKDDLLKGKDVLQCQEQLKKRGYDPGVCDGIFGIKTEAAVINFQTVENLEVDGIVGTVTWQHLFTEV